MTYAYKKSKLGFNEDMTERYPNRVMKVVDSQNYRGLGIDNSWKIQDEVQVVNGIVEKSDGTFLQNFFMNEIGEKSNPYNLILGSYPVDQKDFKEISKRATAILSVQSDEELK